jgi:hypothetical protein
METDEIVEGTKPNERLVLAFGGYLESGHMPNLGVVI